jgi:hypothetical protein
MRAAVDPGAGRWQSTQQMDRNPAPVNPKGQWPEEIAPGSLASKETWRP